MTRWIRADLAQVHRSEWRGYVEEFHLFFSGTTKAQAEQACREGIEATEGLQSFEIIFLPC